MTFALSGCWSGRPPSDPPGPTVGGNLQTILTYAQNNGTLQSDGRYRVAWYSWDYSDLYWFQINSLGNIDFSIAQTLDATSVWIDWLTFSYHTINSTNKTFTFDSVLYFHSTMVADASCVGTLTRTGTTTFTTSVVAWRNTFSITNNADLSFYAYETFLECQKFLLNRVGVALFV